MLIWYLGIWLHLDIDSQWAVKPVLVPATSTTAEDWNYPIVFPNGNWGIVATVSTTQLSHTLPDGTQAVSVIADNSINTQYIAHIITYNRHSDSQRVTSTILTLGR